MDKNWAIEKEKIESARRSKKATHIEGGCSVCGERVPFANFCMQCGATFLTEEQIHKGKLNLPEL